MAEPITEQPRPKYFGRVVNEEGKLILDTRTGYRDDAECERVRQRMIEAGWWQIVPKETPQ